VVKTAGFATFARVMLEALAGAHAQWHPVVWWLAAATMIVGNVLALTQRNLVRLLAYSSIAHAGYLLVAIVANSAAGSTALLFYTVSYTLATIGAFGVLIAINQGADRAPTVDDIAGLWLVRPGLAVSMAVFFLAFLGMPLVGGMGFFAKWYILQAALQSSAPQTVLAVILVITSVISAAYYLTVISAMFMRPRAEGKATPLATPLTGGVVLAMTIALLLLGVYPTPVIKLARIALPQSLLVARPDSVRPATLLRSADFR
jgi:NADH-quinone oxidoreductase subunit N